MKVRSSKKRGQVRGRKGQGTAAQRAGVLYRRVTRVLVSELRACGGDARQNALYTQPGNIRHQDMQESPLRR